MNFKLRNGEKEDKEDPVGALKTFFFKDGKQPWQEHRLSRNTASVFPQPVPGSHLWLPFLLPTGCHRR